MSVHVVQQQTKRSQCRPPIHTQGNGSSSAYAPVPAAGSSSSSFLGSHSHRHPATRTRVRVVRLEKEVADFHLREAAARGKGPEQVKVGTIDVVLYAKEHWPGTAFALTLGALPWPGRGLR